MQIVHGGKISRLHDLLVIREKTFTIVQQFETPYKKEKIHWKIFTIGSLFAVKVFYCERFALYSIYTLTYSIFNGGFFPLQRLDSVQVAFFNNVLLLVGFLYIL